MGVEFLNVAGNAKIEGKCALKQVTMNTEVTLNTLHSTRLTEYPDKQEIKTITVSSN